MMSRTKRKGSKESGHQSRAPAEEKNRLLECLGHLRVRVEREQKGWHGQHLRKLHELLERHQKMAESERLSSVPELRKNLARIASDRTAGQKLALAQGIYEELLAHEHNAEKAGKIARNALTIEEYERVMSALYARTLLEHIDAFEREKQRR